MQRQLWHRVASASAGPLARFLHRWGRHSARVRPFPLTEGPGTLRHMERDSWCLPFHIIKITPQIKQLFCKWWFTIDLSYIHLYMALCVRETAANTHATRAPSDRSISACKNETSPVCRSEPRAACTNEALAVGDAARKGPFRSRSPGGESVGKWHAFGCGIHAPRNSKPSCASAARLM